MFLKLCSELLLIVATLIAAPFVDYLLKPHIPTLTATFVTWFSRNWPGILLFGMVAFWLWSERQ